MKDYIKLPLKTAAALGAARISANAPPPGHLRGVGKCCCVYLGGYRGTLAVVSASVLVTLACSQIFHVSCPRVCAEDHPASVCLCSHSFMLWAERWVRSQRQDVQAGSNVIKIWDHWPGCRGSGDFFMPTLILEGGACPPRDYQQASAMTHPRVNGRKHS